MTRKINLVIRLQHWMDSVPGQTFLNYAYSWGAAIVILGTLFKLTYLPGANFMLFLGMGTEVVVFFLSAFDRPFDKTEEGKELPKYYETDDEIIERIEQEEAIHHDTPLVKENLMASDTSSLVSDNSFNSTEQIRIPKTSSEDEQSQVATQKSGHTATASTATTDITSNPTLLTNNTQTDAVQLAQIIRLANDELLRRAQAILSPEMEDATKNYIDKLQHLNDTLMRVDEQNRTLERDSKEMEQLGRALTGISTVYELQLKGVSAQVANIDRINEQTCRMAEQIEELNGVYARMIQALTVNMRNTSGVNNSSDV